MRVLHTPVLRPKSTFNTVANNDICNNSGAGIVINNNGDMDIDIQSRRYRPDMRKLASNNGSPNFAIHIDMDKTPTVLGGREEHFGSITDIIVQEGMEEEEGGEEICLERGGMRETESENT